MAHSIEYPSSRNPKTTFETSKIRFRTSETLTTFSILTNSKTLGGIQKSETNALFGASSSFRVV